MSSLFNLTPNIIPYNLSLLQDIEVDTINGDTYLPFNGVVGNTNYPLIYNNATGILSQIPITQNVDYDSNPRFSSVNCNDIFNDTGGDLSINNPYGLIVIGGSLSVGGNISIYGVSNKVVLAAENTIDYSLRFPLIRNTVADAPLIVSTATGAGYQTLDYNDQAVKTTSNVSFSSIKCNTLLAPSTILNTVKIGGSGGTASQPFTGYNYIRITTTSTITGGASIAFMTGNDTYRGNIGADAGYIYI